MFMHGPSYHYKAVSSLQINMYYLNSISTEFQAELLEEAW